MDKNSIEHGELSKEELTRRIAMFPNDDLIDYDNIRVDDIYNIIKEEKSKLEQRLLRDFAGLTPNERHDVALRQMSKTNKEDMIVGMTTAEFDEVCGQVKKDGVVIGLKRAEFAIKEELQEVKRKPIAQTFE